VYFKVYYHNQADPPLGTVLVLFNSNGVWVLQNRWWHILPVSVSRIWYSIVKQSVILSFFDIQEKLCPKDLSSWNSVRILESDGFVASQTGFLCPLSP